MSPLTNGAPTARRLTLAAGALIAAATFASPAEAAFTTGACQGDAIIARGASFASNAHNQVFVPAFGGNFCAAAGGAPTVTYEGTGSGSGRRVMGARTTGAPEGDNTSGAAGRSYAPRLAGTDEPLSANDQANINKGSEAVGDEGVIRTIPIALGSVAIPVNLPDGCVITQQADGSALTGPQQAQLSDPATANTRRLQFTRTQLEQIFNGGTEIDTWGELVAWINDGNTTSGEATDTRCSNFPIVRIRRLDDSGTTYALKDYLSKVNPGRGWLTAFNTPDTRTWPNDNRVTSFDYNNDGDSTDTIPSCAAQFGATPTTTCTEASVPLLQTTEVAAPAGNGNGSIVNKVNDFDGSIGYGDLATIRQNRSFAFERQPNATDDKYWTKIQTKNLTGFADPQQFPAGIAPNGPRGSACNTAVLSNLPGGNDPTTGNWSQVSAADSTAAGYGICTPTYALAWDDYATPYATQPSFSLAGEERKARTVKDYLENIVGPGQDSLVAFDYATLSSSTKALSAAGIAKIGFNKAGDVGNQNPTPTPVVNPTPTPVGGGGNTPTPPPAVQTPAPTPKPIIPNVPSNAFTTSAVKNDKGAAKFTVTVPGAGVVSIVGKATLGKKKNAAAASASSSAKAAGTVAFTVKLNSAAAKELKKKKKLKVTLEITYTPTGGTAKTATATVTLKPAPAKKKTKK